MMIPAQGKRLQFWIGIAVSLVSLLAVFAFTDPAAILRSLQSASPGYLLLSFAGILGFLALRAVRWRFMLGPVVPLDQVFHIQNIGYLLTNVLPFRVGEVARAVLIGNIPPATVAQGISTMVVERLLDMLFIITLLPFTLAEIESLPGWMEEGARGLGLVSIGGVILLIVAANQRSLARRLATFIFDRFPFLDTNAWVKRTDDLLLGLNSLTRLRDGLTLLLLSIILWLPILFAYDTAMLAVGLRPDLAMTAFVVCAAALSIAAPSSPGQVGVFHIGVTVALVEVLGQPADASASFAFVYHALNFATMVLMGLVGIRFTRATFAQVIGAARTFLGRRTTINGAG